MEKIIDKSDGFPQFIKRIIIMIIMFFLVTSDLFSDIVLSNINGSLISGMTPSLQGKAIQSGVFILGYSLINYMV